MAQTMSITEARDNFPALVRRVAEQDEPIVVTLRSHRATHPTFAPQTRVQLQDRLFRYIEFGLLNHFLVGIEEIIDSTQCGFIHLKFAALCTTSDNFGQKVIGSD